MDATHQSDNRAADKAHLTAEVARIAAVRAEQWAELLDRERELKARQAIITHELREAQAAGDRARIRAANTAQPALNREVETLNRDAAIYHAQAPEAEPEADAPSANRRSVRERRGRDRSVERWCGCERVHHVGDADRE